MKTGFFNEKGQELSLEEVIAKLPTHTINRFEVIDETGRVYVNWKPTNKIDLFLQDDERTLKVRISNKEDNIQF